MSLDLTKVASQVIAMISGLKDAREERRQRLQFALDTLNDRAINIEKLKKKIAASRTTWLVAELVEGLDKRCPAPLNPADFTVIGSDGSHIDVDRHRSNRCYLINIGSAVITYGSRPDAVLSNSPRLYSNDEDLVISSPDGDREQVVEGAILGIKRSVEECRHLAALAAQLPADSDCLTLLDGTLILWGLEAYPEFVTQSLLNDGFLACLDRMKQLKADRRLALASYISFPRSTDVVNVLRVVVCPHDVVDSDRLCRTCTSRECDKVQGVRDRDLFINLLENGERSALFISPSKIVKERYGDHRVHFFYLRVDDEIARIEIPQWVAENDRLLDLTHGLISDQCHCGQGYPVVLAEAHEQAVVTGADRENFWELVESSMIDEHLPSPGSAKSFSKRTRWI
ncbi:MAG TPA: DNA double-strand break repair nuclease NurA [Dehalococcoidia bacterium]|nr:DNA double-strand break repair nuclease NurA [Dehalococcoidia bacterium]